MNIKLKLITAAALLISSNYAIATGMPTCSAIAKLDSKPVDKLLTVVIDQTTLVDQNMINKFKRIAGNAITDGTEVKVLKFSAFSQGEYFTEVFSASKELPLTEDERYTIPKKQLSVYDRCLKQQGPALMHKSLQVIETEMKSARADLAKSDIAYNLSKVAERVKNHQATTKNVLIFSDMIENSSITSFYRHGKVRVIDVEKDIAEFQKNGIQADFSGANLYVMGAGLLSEKGKNRGVYRDPKTLNSLEKFWSKWFDLSHAKLQGFGMPELHRGIQ